MIHNAIVPVSSRALARTTTPSRRRRIIYESARRLTREYLSNAIYNIESSTKAARLIQHVWRTYVHRIQRQDAVNQIHRFYKIAQAKKERCTRRKQKQHRASAVIANFCRRRHEFYLSTSAILIQKSWRGAIARMIAQEAKLTLLELECSAIVIQSFVRTYIARKAFERRHYPPCALLIQRKFRLYLSRKRRKQKMLVNECSRILQHWWRNMMIVIRMLKFAEEERRLRLLLVDEEPTEDDMDLSDAIQSDPVDNESTNNEENEIDSCAGGDSNSQDETINSSAKLEDDSQSTKSSNISFEVSNATEMSICENDDLSISSVKSSQKSSTVDHINEGMRKAMELEHKRNQSAILLQTQIRLFIIKRRRDEHIRKLKEKFAANTLTKQFWIVYQVFIARRERRKRDLERRAVIVIQTFIRSFLATRFVDKYRESVYEQMLDRFDIEFNNIHKDKSPNHHSSHGNKSWLPKIEPPSFLAYVCDEEVDDPPFDIDKENHSPTKNVVKNIITSFHNDWIELLPESSRNMIPKGCNLHGIDVEDEGCLISCGRFFDCGTEM